MDERTLNTVAAALQWEARYRKGEHLSGKGAFLPEISCLDPDFEQALLHFGIVGGRLLDIGTGLGEQAMHFSLRGFKVTAADVSPSAVEHAKKAAADAGGEIEFLTDDILRTSLQGPYDLIVDRGCYTLLDQSMREDYCSNVYKLLSPIGLFFLKTDANEKNVARELGSRFRLLEFREACYHQEKGPKAAFHVLAPKR